MTKENIQFDIETLTLLRNTIECLLRAQSITQRDYELQDLKYEIDYQIHRLENIKKEQNYTYTENGALALNSTSNALVDLFAISGAMRERSDEEIELMFSKALIEDKLLAVKLAFYTRDVRGGLGERRSGRVMLKYLAKHYPNNRARAFLDCFTYSDNSIDGKSSKKSYSLFESGILDSMTPGSVESLQQIHAYLFGGLYDFAGKIRTKTIAKGNTLFCLAEHLQAGEGPAQHAATGPAAVLLGR